MRRSIATTADRGSELATWAWLGDRELPAKSEVRERTQSLDWGLATYWLALLACCSLFGLVVGGYVGFMENATPHADPPHSFAQPAASDVGWTARIRQDRQAARPLEFVAAGQHMRETRRQRLIESAVADRGSGGTPSPTMLGGHLIRLDAPAADGVPRSPDREVELSERTNSRTVTDR